MAALIPIRDITSLRSVTQKKLRVGDLARRTGKTVRAIHLYEELGLVEPIDRSKGGYRLFGEDAVVRVRWIGKLQEMGFSLQDIREMVQQHGVSSSAPNAMRRIQELYRRKLDETREQISRLDALRGELEASLAYLETCDHSCDPQRLVDACKSCDLHSCEDHAPELVAGFQVKNQ